MLRSLRYACILAALVLPLAAQATIPTWVGAGSLGTNTSGNCSAGLPSGTQTNDILIVVAASNDAVSHSVSGYTVKLQGTQTEPSDSVDGHLSISWKRHDGSEGTATVSHSGGSYIHCKQFAIRGATTSGDPFDAAGSLQLNDANERPVVTTNGITTNTADTLVLHIINEYNGTGWSSWSDSVTERIDQQNDPYVTLGMGVGTVGKSSTGSTTSFDVTQDGPFTHHSGSVLMAIKSTVACPGVPGNPTYTSITATSARVNWTAGSNADTYTIARAPDSGGSPGTYTDPLVTGISALFYDNSGLTSGNRYWYKVKSVNSCGSSSYSSGTKLTLLPATPGNPTFTAVHNTTMQVNWTSANGADTYKVERSPSGCASFAQIASGVAGLSYVDTGLSANTTYCYKVRGTNGSGDGAYDTSASQATTNTLPSTPGDPTYTNVAGTTLTVNWTAASDADSYKLERAPFSGTCGAYSQIATPSGLTYNDSGLTEGTTYCYKVRGHNTVGDGSYSLGTQVTTGSLPGAPGTPNFTNISGSTLTVNWAAGSGATSYKVERSPSGCGSFVQIASGITDLFYNDTGRTFSTTYCYKVRGTNSVGDGLYSSNNSVTTASSDEGTGYIRYACWAPTGNCFSVRVNGGRIDFGSGDLDYATSDGTSVSFAGPIKSLRMLRTMSSDRGDNNVTLVVGTDVPIQMFGTNLTANRTVTCSTTGAVNGDSFRVVRQGLGAFTLDVCGQKTIPSATAAWVDVAYSGAAWVLIGYGTL